MSLATSKQRELAWHCRRGLLELDILLNNYVTNYFHAMNEREYCLFEQLLLYPDQELLEMLMRRMPAREKGEQDVINKIIQAIKD